ncbi:zinc-dependent alcohol dehydrogenase [Enterococcus xiangfangensis]|uniref:zinc-dependent alcohol dehydrogenase n=1 Tax=Enterococcus xiangfangensis TaxID=1296537 RepID=UPI0010F6EDD2|nr:alcohol dehydrogenase catalytic domain-containing protein [Enterococcus xiangfangensis]MBM7712290.1 2-desacetyl-2-hydroxyethyl bacteriochlorophyllide A dehydrogenase [Enterococcus xiangfangensis]NBK08768.1 alcohol dehydrogenase [Enterococcus asini]
MKTAVFYDVKNLVVEETPMPEVPKEKILMKIDTCAICTWEQRVYTGVKKVSYPFIGGHEIAGEIVKIGEAVEGDWKQGDKIVFGTNLACGHCYYCRIGEEQNCLNFDHSKQQPGLPYRGMGGLSEYLIVDPSDIFSYQNVAPEEASLTEPLSCVLHSVETAKVDFGDYVLIIGAGIMGMLHLQLAQKRGAIVIVSDPNEKRLELAKSLGATHVINPVKEDLTEKILAYTENLGAQIIFNTTPISGLIPGLLESLSNTGTMILYSSYYPDEPVGLKFDHIHKTGQQIKGTANSNKRDFIRASRLISQGIVDVKPFITKIYPLSQIEPAFEEAVNTESFRIVIDFEQERSEESC